MPSYRNYLLSVLLVTLAFNYVDRLALALLLQDIKVDLRLSDTQLGLMTGMAFALFYSVMGIPIARWADRGNRVTIITLSVALWSAAVAFCGMAGSFLQLLLIRVGVGVGEAGCIPPAHSLIADYFTRAERPRAVAKYMLGAPVSSIVGFFLAGWLNELYGWRLTFLILGLPGLALAALVRLTVREPRRRNDVPAIQELPEASSPVVEVSQAGMKHVCMTLWNNKTFRNLLIGYSVSYFFAYGISQWKGAFFVRSYGLQTGELGTWFAVIYGIGGFLGTYLGGELASRFAARDESRQLKAIAVAYCGFALISACIYLSHSHYVALGFMALATFGLFMTSGPLFATIQTLVPANMRAISIAVFFLFANLIGMGLGPLAAGILSDALRSWLGDESLRYALLALCPGYFWTAWHLSSASRTVTSDLERVHREERSVGEGVDPSMKCTTSRDPEAMSMPDRA